MKCPICECDVIMVSGNQLDVHDSDTGESIDAFASSCKNGHEFGVTPMQLARLFLRNSKSSVSFVDSVVFNLVQ